MKKTGLLVVVVLLVSGGYFLLSKKPLRKLDPFTAQEAADKTLEASRFLREKGEEELKKKQLLPLIRVYEDLLKKYPDNQDLKKKLAELYDQIDQPEKAKSLEKKHDVSGEN